MRDETTWFDSATSRNVLVQEIAPSRPFIPMRFVALFGKLNLVGNTFKDRWDIPFTSSKNENPTNNSTIDTPKTLPLPTKIFLLRGTHDA